jgi:two-component system nitrogen regulation response regulator GlnG
LPESILESELFGHEKGAFTGADSLRIGKFELARGGSIFLDEVGDMSIVSQAKILRLLQERKFERVGGNETIEADVRVIAATNRNLRALVDAGLFRLDLFYRLEVFTIRLPALRDRLADLPLLVRHFLQRGNVFLERRVRGISPEVYRLLESYNWPGNVRELQSAITFAILHATGDVITPDCLPEKLRGDGQLSEKPLAPGTLDRHVAELLAGVDDDIYDHVHAAVDRILLPMVIEHVHGSQSEAATRLGITRTTLRSRMRSLGLVAEKRLISEPDRDEQ